MKNRHIVKPQQSLCDSSWHKLSLLSCSRFSRCFRCYEQLWGHPSDWRGCVWESLPGQRQGWRWRQTVCGQTDQPQEGNRITASLQHRCFTPGCLTISWWGVTICWLPEHIPGTYRSNKQHTACWQVDLLLDGARQAVYAPVTWHLLYRLFFFCSPQTDVTQSP